MSRPRECQPPGAGRLDVGDAPLLDQWEILQLARIGNQGCPRTRLRVTTVPGPPSRRPGCRWAELREPVGPPPVRMAGPMSPLRGGLGPVRPRGPRATGALT